jgi:hypothetical protein
MKQGFFTRDKAVCATNDMQVSAQATLERAA